MSSKQIFSSLAVRELLPVCGASAAEMLPRFSRHSGLNPNRVSRPVSVGNGSGLAKTVMAPRRPQYLTPQPTLPRPLEATRGQQVTASFLEVLRKGS
jgi:hypothetical protein